MSTKGHPSNKHGGKDKVAKKFARMNGLHGHNDRPKRTNETITPHVDTFRSSRPYNIDGTSRFYVEDLAGQGPGFVKAFLREGKKNLSFLTVPTDQLISTDSGKTWAVKPTAYAWGVAAIIDLEEGTEAYEKAQQYAH